jgi:hypothetical protein
MKLFKYFILFCALIYSCFCYSQGNAGKFGLEIVKTKIGFNAGPYRGRTNVTNGFFNQGVAGFGQIYFPFQMAIDYRDNFSDSVNIINEYNNRIFLIRPAALFHVIDNGSYAMGLTFQLSWLLVKQFYLEYQIGPVYVEATKGASPDLNSGFSLHHYVSISKPLSKSLTISGGITHMSNASITSSSGANHDLLSLGIKYGF